MSSESANPSLASQAHYERLKEIDVMLNVVIQTAQVMTNDPFKAPKGMDELCLKAQSRLLSLIPGVASPAAKEASRLIINGLHWVVERDGDNVVAHADVDTMQSTAVVRFQGTKDVIRTLKSATADIQKAVEQQRDLKASAGKKKKVSSVETVKSKKAKAKKVKS